MRDEDIFVRTSTKRDKEITICLTLAPLNLELGPDTEKILKKVTEAVGSQFPFYAARIRGGFWLFGRKLQPDGDSGWDPIYGHEQGQKVRSFERALAFGLIAYGWSAHVIRHERGLLCAACSPTYQY